MNTISHLESTTVVVTGAGRGIGAACVRQLLRDGASVLALVQPGAENELAALAGQYPQRLRILDADVRSTGQASAAAAAAEQYFGGADVLVNNAGVIHPIGRLAEVDPDQWAEVLAINAAGAMRCTRAFLPQLLARQGLIVNMSSGAAYRPLDGWSAYCASKAALVMLSRATDLEYRGQGLRVFSLGIPPTDTRMQGSIRDSGINEVSRIPRQSLNSPRVTARVVAWLCGPRARARIDKVEVDVRDPEFAVFTKETE
ncbi:SDR family oxidoreductase [Bordetella genomosp. 10]|uniref:SDR family oxidoreductase n=1 Tax=Bordetella genomosp. 10 TaxID=1416804 RepID=UPI0015C65EA0|nr:SDR family oxidoreductase [Bordetella genomosp. 10]